MDCRETANKSIGCTVSKCRHHCNVSDYCTLSKVDIGTHESDPTQCECVDCESFEPKG